ncbi:hypothetical protein [Streptosporangium saharense]|uniref:hypothetical protein n=1 Tax=Streptosporangium saharense TaxID=1706840 RepID=UPI00342EA142
MPSLTVNEDSRLSLWLRVREFAVPPTMIESATARRTVGDWAGACAAARVDIDLDLHTTARTHGRELANRIRDDLRHLAPDLLRWHMPRIAPDGLLRPGLTVSLARYRDTAAHLVARTPPAWAGAGQRISLALWDGSNAGPYPHPHPHRRFRLDLHRHLWDARRAGELRFRSGPDRWVPEARILLDAEGRADGAVAVRLGRRHRLLLDLTAEHPAARVTAAPSGGDWPLLPDAATWVSPDLALLRAGLIEADRLHPLVAAALVPGHSPAPARRSSGERLVECRGVRHRIGLVDGVLVPLDHDPAEIHRERLLFALTGTPLPCLRVIEEAHRDPVGLLDIRARLDHGDVAGALAAIEGLLGPGASLPEGALRDELERAARRRVQHGLFRSGLAEVGQKDREVPRQRSRR